MIASSWYDQRAAHWSAARDRDTRTATRLSRLRLITFGAGVILIGWAWRVPGRSATDLLFIAGFAAFVVFGVLVRQHARVLDCVDRAETGLRLANIGRARIARDWQALPDVAPPADLNYDTHPYARDLDLFGHASLTKWIGRTATAGGLRTLWQWLLTPAGPGAALARQAAIDDLAARRDWREALAIEGALATLPTGALARFLEWTDGRRSAVPAFMRAAAVLLPVTLAALLSLFLAGAVQRAWWLIPLAINIALSFIFALKAYATFDRVSVGERVLDRYSRMFALVCETTWTSPLLARLHGALGAGEPAPAAIRRIARIADWSELRTGAALLHFPIQAFTLWDFHVLFAMERWRARSGVHVRAWLEALGEFDALSALAIVRADEPDWTMPRIETDADSIAATALAHPLIAGDRRVANDVRIGPPGTLLLVTGSNMSGKSTLLRAIGLNTVLAQAGAPVCAAAMTLPPVEFQTSIRVQDSLELGLSYFMAALARLKQIVDAARRGSADPGRRMLYLLDEVLQGTNSIERAVAVRAVAQHLIDARAIGAMTTHDLGLADDEPLKSCAARVHFTEQVHPDGTMTFDYRLRDGIATSTNALRLMQLIGIEPR
jgi:hypothetical protein